MAPKRGRTADAAKQPAASRSKRVLHVFPEDAEAEDTVLLCASGHKVVTTAALLEMLSPSVLRGAVEAARQQGGVAGSSSTSSASQGLQLPCDGDTAEVWLHCLQLKHPAVLSSHVPVLSWTDLCSMVQLADKYAMASVLDACESLMLSKDKLYSTPAPAITVNDDSDDEEEDSSSDEDDGYEGSSSDEDSDGDLVAVHRDGNASHEAAGLLESIKMARRYNLHRLEAACWEQVEVLVRKVSATANKMWKTLFAKLSADYMVREKVPGGGWGAKDASAAAGGADDACVLVTLLMKRLAAVGSY